MESKAFRILRQWKSPPEERSLSCRKMGKKEKKRKRKKKSKVRRAISKHIGERNKRMKILVNLCVRESE